ILPDVDIITSGHRAISHSILFPLIFLFILFNFNKNMENNRKWIIGRHIGILWLSHIIFDLTFGPIAIFYPLDKRFYVFTMGVIFGLEGNAILPITLRGIFIQVGYLDQNVGINRFFINWSSEERTSYFGSTTLNWPINDFMVHFVLFSWYLYKVIIPLLFDIINNSGIRRFRLFKISNYLKKLNMNDLIAICILISLFYFSLWIGILGGKQWNYEEKLTENYWITSESIKISSYLEFEIPDNSTLFLSMSMESSSLPYKFFILYDTRGKTQLYREEISQIVNKIGKENISMTDVFIMYQQYVSSLSNLQIYSINDTNGFSYNINYSLDNAILIGLYNWDISISFIRQLNIVATWEISRIKSFQLGNIFSIVTISLICIKLIKIIKKTRNTYPTNEK
ncbi:MAG: metal-dependent hydrolase, partial [Candidatus Heimdallarchaeota archaeon]|nr:metal-dependent hydrolase [Candidatus Heimdallarchaeota archaeon]